MLVFTRKAGESMVIAEQIEVKILGVEKDQVKIGISAPRHVSVHRQEIHELIKRENRAASSRPVKDWESLKRLIEKK